MRQGLITLVLLTAPLFSRAQGVITTVAGNGTDASTGDGGPATSASFHPNGVTVDKAGNIYIADLAASVIRKVNTAGIISTVAGFPQEKTQFSGDGGPATSASIYISSNHNALAVDGAGNLYIADDGHHRIRKVSPSGIITTVAGNGKIDFSGDGGPATSASLYRPSGVAVDHDGNIYIADTQNVRIRKVDTSGNISTVAGNGAIGYSGDGELAVNAALFYPMGVAVDPAGNIYIADQNAYVVRKVNKAGIISTVAGNGAFGFSGDGGLATSAELSGVYSVAVNGAGDIYIADFGNHRVRKVDTSGTISTVAGNGGATGTGDGGPPDSANLRPADIAFDAAGNYYIADFGHNSIRKVTLGAKVPGLLTSAGSLYFSTAANGNNSPGSQKMTVYTEGTVPLNFTASVSTSSGGNWLSTPTSAGKTSDEITVSIGNLPSSGLYQGAIVLIPESTDLPAVRVPVTLNVNAAPPSRPAITGAVNGASFQPGVAANSWATIVGTNLASTTDTWDRLISNGQLPTSLDGVTVTFDGKPAYLSYISPTQINLVVPNIDSTPAGVVVTNLGVTETGLFDTAATQSSQYGPAFFLWPNNQAVATRQDYSYAAKPGTFAGLATVAAKPGDVIILWGEGFGPTTPATPLGFVTPSDQTYSTSTLPTVTIDNVSATVYGAALAPGFAGLYQIAIQVPSTLGNGDWPVVASIGAVSSPNGVVLAVQQ
jgi:uncharacterized protein (TIGR03437 family)